MMAQLITDPLSSQHQHSLANLKVAKSLSLHHFLHANMYYIILVILLEYQESHIKHFYGAKNTQGECLGSRPELKLLFSGLHDDWLLLFTQNPLVIKIVQLKAKQAAEKYKDQ